MYKIHTDPSFSLCILSFLVYYGREQSKRRVEMEDIFRKLSEIDNAAKTILENTEKEKQALSAEMEKKCRQFDEEIEAEYRKKLARIHLELDKEKASRLETLEKERLVSMDALDAWFAGNLDQISRQIADQVLKG